MTILARPSLWFQRMPREARWLVFICLVALLLRVWPLSGVSTDYDEGVYWQSLRAMANGQPLFSSIFSSQPPFFLLSVYPLYLLFGQSLTAARLAIALFSLVGIVAAYVVGRRLAGMWAGLLAALLLAVDPLFLTESRTLQAEAPAISLEIVAVALALTSMQAESRRRIALAALAGAALGLGVMTKLFDVVAVIPVFAYLALPMFSAALSPRRSTGIPNESDVRSGLRATGLACLACLGGALVVSLLVMLPFAENWSVAYDQVIRFHTIAARDAGGGILGNFMTIAHVRSEYPLWVAALAGCVVSVWRRRWEAAPIALWLVASVAVLVQQRPLFLHHMALLAPPLVVLASMTASGVPEVARRVADGVTGSRIWASRIALAVVLGCAVAGLLIGVKSDTHAAHSPSADTLRLAAAIRVRTLPTDYIATDDQYIAGLADRNVISQLVDTSLVRIQSGYLTASQLESLITSTDTRMILFASGRFDQVPGFRAWVEEHYSAVPEVGDGHMLYVKEPQGPSPV